MHSHPVDGRPAVAGRPMIRLRNLGRRFGEHWAVRGMSLEVAAGEVLGLLGPNGAGKTTTVRMLTALIASTVAGVIVSARVNDARVGQQIGGVVIVPIVAISLLQATGTFLVGAAGYLVLAAAIGVLSLVGLRVGVWLFRRESILTRWR